MLPHSLFQVSDSWRQNQSLLMPKWGGSAEGALGEAGLRLEGFPHFADAAKT